MTAAPQEALPTNHRRLPGREVFVLIGVVATGVVISFLRTTEVQRDSLWGEDATVFLNDALRHGRLASIFQGYAGYQHFLPRIIAGTLTGWVPLEWYALAVFAVCIVIVALIAAATYWLSQDLVKSRIGRIGLAAIPLALPLTTKDVLGNTANVHTYLLWLAIWIVVYRPRKWWGSMFWAAVMFVCAMTEIQTVPLLGILLFRLRKHDRLTWPIYAGLAIGAVWQVVTTLSAPRNVQAHWLGWRASFEGWLVNTVLPLVQPERRAAQQFLADHGAGWLVTLVVFVLIVGMVGFVFGTNRLRVLLLAFPAASVVIYVATLNLNGAWYAASARQPPAFAYEIINTRYGVISGWLLLAIVPVSAAAIVAAARNSWPARTAIANTTAGTLVGGLIVAMLVVSLHAHPDSPARATWSEQVRAAVATCQTQDLQHVVHIWTTPTRFSAKFRCAELLTLSR